MTSALSTRLCIRGYSIFFAIFAHCRQIRIHAGIGLQVANQVVERSHAHDRDAIVALDLLHGGQFTAAALHSVERNDNATGHGASGLDDFD